MSADIDALATAVGAQLNDPARTWAGQFTATIGKTPDYTIEGLATLKVHVLPFGESDETTARAIDRTTLILEVAFQQTAAVRPEAGPDTPLIELGNALVLLEKNVKQFLRKTANRQPPTYPAAYLIKTELVPLYDAGILSKERRFAGVLRLRYQEFVETD